MSLLGSERSAMLFALPMDGQCVCSFGKEIMVMETKRKEAIASSVFVEFFDVLGNSLGQAAYLEWRNKPVPDVGDTLCCEVASAVSGRGTKMTGRVRARHFDVQLGPGGAPNVVVRLAVDVPKTGSKSHRDGPYRIAFSRN
jgi:hypothetical protein